MPVNEHERRMKAIARWRRAITPTPGQRSCSECNATLDGNVCPFARAEEKMRG